MISQCPSCKKQIEVPEAALGKKVRCSGCQAVFVAEASAAPPSKLAPPSPPPPPPKPPPPPPPPKKEEPEPLDMLEEVAEEPAPKPKKKSTAKKKTEPKPESLDMLEVLDEEPARTPKKKDAAKKPMAKSEPADADNPFSFEGPSPLAAAPEPAASLDFGAQQPRLNVGMRMRITGAGRMMMIGACMSFVLSIIMLVQTMFAPPTRAYLWGGMAAAGLVYVGAVMIILCARSLRVLRSRMLGVTAAILCLLIALPGLGGSIMALILLITGLTSGAGAAFVVIIVAVILGLVSLVQCINCLWGGISTLIFIFRADVGEAIQESLQREASVAATSPKLVPDSCRRAAVWQIAAAILIFLHLAVNALLLGFLMWKPPAADSTFVKIALGVVIFFFVVLLLMNVGAVVSLFMKRFFLLANLGGVASLVAAVFSYFGGIISLPSVLVALMSRDPILMGITIATAVFMILLNVVGLVGFMATMDAARLLRKYGSGPVKEVKAS